jgi:hypothetical protein
MKFTLPHRQPTPESRQKGDDLRKATTARKHREQSIRYCQICSKGYYPEEKSFVIIVNGNSLRVCEECYEERKND